MILDSKNLNSVEAGDNKYISTFEIRLGRFCCSYLHQLRVGTCQCLFTLRDADHGVDYYFDDLENALLFASKFAVRVGLDGLERRGSIRKRRRPVLCTGCVFDRTEFVVKTLSILKNSMRWNTDQARRTALHQRVAFSNRLFEHVCLTCFTVKILNG